MNERERWIVYPLLFFALGASLRDKFLQHVSSKEIECQRLVAKQIECEGGIACQGVVVFDQDDRGQALVEMGRTQPVAPGPGQPPRSFGALILRDSSGQVICGALDNALFVRQVNCEDVRILDPSRESRVLAGLTSVTVAGPDGVPRPFGVLVLNNEDFGTVTGNPPRGVIQPRTGAEESAAPERPPQEDEEGAEAESSDSAG